MSSVQKTATTHEHPMKWVLRLTQSWKERISGVIWSHDFNISIQGDCWWEHGKAGWYYQKTSTVFGLNNLMMMRTVASGVAMSVNSIPVFRFTNQMIPGIVVLALCMQFKFQYTDFNTHNRLRRFFLNLVKNALPFRSNGKLLNVTIDYKIRHPSNAECNYCLKN